MRWDSVYEGESLEQLSARLKRPACMLLRANRLFSAAWLLPGREILVPDPDFCAKDQGICPAVALNLPARSERSVWHRVFPGETAAQIAARYGITPRMVLCAAGRTGGALPEGLRLRLPLPPRGACAHTVLPGERAGDLAGSLTETEFRRLNGLWGPLLPGMRVLIIRQR